MKLYSVSLATGRNKSVKVEPIEATSSKQAIRRAIEITGKAEFIQLERLTTKESSYWLDEEPDAIHLLPLEYSTPSQSNCKI